MDLVLSRVKRDLTEIYAEEMDLIHVVPQEDNIKLVHALIEGPDGTPYSGGFFYFTVRFPIDYPCSPPTVVLQTTGMKTVRFNPNMYDGMICLSILHTWSGPQWTPAMSLKSVLLSIQSLMNEEPYYNEPGFEKRKMQGKMSGKITSVSRAYNENIEYETLRIAVIRMLEEDGPDARGMPKALKDVMVERFKMNFKKYVGLLGKIKVPRRDLLGCANSLEKMKTRLLNLKIRFGIEDDMNNSKVDDTDKQVKEPVAYEAVSSEYVKHPTNEKDRKIKPENVDTKAVIEEFNLFLPSDSDDDYDE